MENPNPQDQSLILLGFPYKETRRDSHRHEWNHFSAIWDETGKQNKTKNSWRFGIKEYIHVQKPFSIVRDMNRKTQIVFSLNGTGTGNLKGP